MRATLISLLLLGLSGCGDSDVTTDPRPKLQIKPPPWMKNPLPVAEPVGDPIENSIGMVLVPIPAGEFYMGRYIPEIVRASRSHETSDVFHPKSTLHRVKITASFYLGQTEVTQGQWIAVMDTTPWKDQDNVKHGDDYPATYVSWTDAVEFCRKLSAKENVEYRLPTEAEWEYACRAGTKTKYSFDNYESQLKEHAWFKEPTHDVSQISVHVVRRKKPNPWGLHDMYGNVYEWCQDWHGDYPTGDLIDPKGPPAQGNGRVMRGGSFRTEAKFLSSADRNNRLPENRADDFGLRVARTAP